MNAKDINEALTSHNWVNRECYDIAKQLNDINDDYQQGRISASEYRELVQDIDTAGIIAMDAGALQDKERLNTILNAAVSLASTLA